MEASHLKQIISSLVIMLIEANNHLKLLYCCQPIKLNLKRTSSCLEETMNVDKLTVFMDSMMNVKTDTVLDFGRNFKMFLIVYRLQHSLTTKFFACTEGFLLNQSQFRNSNKLQDLLKSLKMDYFAICFGPIPKKVSQVGVKTIVEFPTLLVRLSLKVS